jgi:hypothetical protein
VAIGLAVARRELRPGTVDEVWLASGDVTPAGAPCPVCGRPLRPVNVEPTGVALNGPLAVVPAGAGPPGVGSEPVEVLVCRTCEILWVSSTAWSTLAAPGGSEVTGVPAEAPAAESPTERCPNCGAPIRLDPDGTCHWCHQATVAQPVVMFAASDDRADPLANLDGPADLAGRAGGWVRRLMERPRTEW